jgi:D-serine deaminase-like pyridoxal phosphate-dependent protein
MSGAEETALDTPALLVDLNILEANIAYVAQSCRDHGVNWRPHFKGHKTLEIARKQLAAGAIGITCAKLGEAEVLAAAGIRDILIANQIAGDIKIARLLRLMNTADVIVSVDSRENVLVLAEAARQNGKTLRVVIEVDIGMNRAGVAPGEPTAALASFIAGQAGLSLVGVMGWEGHVTGIADASAKEKAVAESIGLLTTSAEQCRKAGHDMRIVSCGGTGTFLYCTKQPGVTEVQVGGAIFNDAHYHGDFHINTPFSLTVLTTVTSRPTPTRIVFDAGRKAMSVETALPRPLDIPPVREIKLSAEHGQIELETPSAWPRVGEKIAFIPGYTDTTVHLHEEIVALRQGQVEAVWKVAGRGKIK